MYLNLNLSFNGESADGIDRIRRCLRDARASSAAFAISCQGI
jgi:hypothetical protein